MRKILFFTLATIAGIAVFLLYSFFCTLMEWESAGGYLLLSIVFGVAVILWRYIYGLHKKEIKSE